MRNRNYQNDIMSKEFVNIPLTQSEALVLLDMLARINETKNESLFEHDAERKILWRIETSLEKTVTETFSPNYNELLAKARQEINEAN